MRVLSGGVAVVTGAASGIGRASARALAKEGMYVHVTDIDLDGARQVTREIRQAGGKASAHELDVRDPDAFVALAEQVYDRHGRCDVLHNNAGVAFAAPFDETSLEDWHWVIDINLWGVIHGIHAFVPRMLEQGNGQVVNTASALGLFGWPGVAVYSATKFAVVGLSEALNMELAARNVRITAICPGIISTNIIRAARLRDTAEDQRATVENLYDRFGATPERVAADVLKAIKLGRGMQISPWHVLPLWVIKRLSTPGYQLLFGTFRRLLTR